MKKINKFLLCLATVAMLGGCSNGATAEDAKKAIADLSVDKVTYTSGHAVMTLTKFSGTGTMGTSYAESMKSNTMFSIFDPVAAGSKVEVDINKNQMASFFVNSSTFDKMKEYGATFTVNGTAVSYSCTINQTQTVEGIKITHNATVVGEFNEEGLAVKEVEAQSYTFGSDSEKFEFELTTVVTWNK